MYEIAVNKADQSSLLLVFDMLYEGCTILQRPYRGTDFNSLRPDIRNLV